MGIFGSLWSGIKHGAGRVTGLFGDIAKPIGSIGGKILRGVGYLAPHIANGINAVGDFLGPEIGVAARGLGALVRGAGALARGPGGYLADKIGEAGHYAHRARDILLDRG